MANVQGNSIREEEVSQTQFEFLKNEINIQN